VTLAAALGTVAGVGAQAFAGGGDPIVVALETLLPFGVVFLAVAALLGERIEWRRSAAR
jgi:hypothetical protein